MIQADLEVIKYFLHYGSSTLFFWMMHRGDLTVFKQKNKFGGKGMVAYCCYVLA